MFDIVSTQVLSLHYKLLPILLLILFYLLLSHYICILTLILNHTHSHSIVLSTTHTHPQLSCLPLILTCPHSHLHSAITLTLGHSHSLLDIYTQDIHRTAPKRRSTTHDLRKHVTCHTSLSPYHPCHRMPIPCALAHVQEVRPGCQQCTATTTATTATVAPNHHNENGQGSCPW